MKHLGDLPGLIEDEVQRHLIPGYEVSCQRAENRHAYKVMIGRIGETRPIAVAYVSMGDYAVTCWPVKLLNDLCKEIIQDILGSDQISE